ncbi:hypothetical protein HA402_013400 [Bradysia odoriphaga]|nr:hypothetical protein HA402_013400 [Bradysia odoriphaga]
MKSNNIILLWMCSFCTTLVIAQYTSEAKFGAGEWLTLQSTTTPALSRYYLSHKNGLGFIIPFEATNDDFRWQLVPGLANKNCYSIESKSYPGRYLRHQGYRIKLHLDDGSDLFKKDATWMVREPAPGQVRFESYNYNGHFLRHFNYELWLGSGSGTGVHTARLFLEDSTYNVHFDDKNTADEEGVDFSKRELCGKACLDEESIKESSIK